MGPLISTGFKTCFCIEKNFFSGPQYSHSQQWDNYQLLWLKKPSPPWNSGDFSKLIFKKKLEIKSDRPIIKAGWLPYSLIPNMSKQKGVKENQSTARAGWHVKSKREALQYIMLQWFVLLCSLYYVSISNAAGRTQYRGDRTAACP